MLVYHWMWWGHLTNQNLAWRDARRCAGVCGGARSCMDGCAEVYGGVHGGVQRCTEGHRGVHGGAWRGAQRYMEVHRGVHRGVWRGAQRCASKVHHCLSLVTIDPSNH